MFSFASCQCCLLLGSSCLSILMIRNILQSIRIGSSFFHDLFEPLILTESVDLYEKLIEQLGVLLHKLVLQTGFHVLFHAFLAFIMFVNLQAFQNGIVIVFIQLWKVFILNIIVQKIAKNWHFYEFLWYFISAAFKMVLHLHNHRMIIAIKSKLDLLLAIEFLDVIIVNLNN